VQQAVDHDNKLRLFVQREKGTFGAVTAFVKQKLGMSLFLDTAFIEPVAVITYIVANNSPRNVSLRVLAL
jgi:hypothetical protein